MEVNPYLAGPDLGCRIDTYLERSGEDGMVSCMVRKMLLRRGYSCCGGIARAFSDELRVPLMKS